MGLDIIVNGENYYSRPYHSLHELRAFAAQKEFPADPPYTVQPDYSKPYRRFKALIDHSDCKYGYIPDGVAAPVIISNLATEPALEWQWQSTEELLRELKDLGQYEDEMPEEVREMWEQLTAAVETSIRLQAPIEFM